MFTCTSRAAACALLATTALTLPAVAYAETPAPRFIDTLDDHGVDLVTGLPYLTMEEGGIGSGPGRVAMQRIYAEGAGFLDNWTGGLYDVTSGGVTKKYLQFGGISETFSGSGTAWTSDKADGGTLDVSTGTYTARDGTKIVFQTIGEDKIGCPGVTTLGVCQNPVSITRPDGLKFTLGWDLKVVCIDQPGEPCAIEHDHARLASVSSSAGYKMTIAYASNVGPYTATDPWYQRTSVTFGNTANPPSPAPTITYARPSSTVTNVTDPGGRMWVFTTDSSGRLVGVRRPGSSSDNVSYAYGTGGTVSSSTKDGVTNGYGYSGATATLTNPLGQQTVVTSASGRPTSHRDGLNRTTSFAYDGNSRLTKITAPEGNNVQYDYDARGNIITTTLNPKSGSGLSPIVTHAAFDASCTSTTIAKCNKPNTITDAKGNITDYAYDNSSGLLLSVTRPAPATGAVRPQTRLTYTPVSGAGGSSVMMLTGVSACQTGSADPTPSCVGTSGEAKASVVYNSNLLATSVSRGDGTGALTATKAMSYDSHGSLISVDGPLSGIADTTKYRYDAANQLIGVVSPDPDAAGALTPRAVRVTYRADGQVSKQELGTVVDQSESAWSAFAPAQTVDVGYDTNNRPVTSKLSAAGSDYALTQTSYDTLGRVDCTAVRMNTAVYGSLPASACTLSTQGSFGADRIGQTAYDAAGQVTQQKVAVGTGDEAVERSLGYTANGQLQSLSDAENNKTTYTYDGFDRLSQTQYPSATKGSGTSNPGDYEQLDYDVNGNVTSHRLRDGNSIGYSFDNLDRATLKNLPGTEPDVSYGYDNLGRMTSASQTGIALSFDYDALSRRTDETGPLGTVHSDYDPAGRRTTLFAPGGYQLGFQHLATGELSSILDGGGAALATYSYDDLGRRTLLTFANGANASYTYDAVSRLSSLTNRFADGLANLTINGFAHNPAGQITSDVRSNDDYAFTDGVSGSTGYTSNGRNQLASVGGAAPTWDANGNLTYQPTSGKSYGYDSQNRLTSASSGASLTYDPLGRLYQVTSASANRRFVYDGLALVGEYNSAGAVSGYYVHGEGADEPLVWYDYAGGSGRQFLHADGRGSIVASSDSAGDRLVLNRYDEYGVPASTNSGPFGFTGQLWLPEIGAYHYKARVYFPQLGVFGQTDPIGYADSANLYAYVGDDPVNFTDPMGLSAGGSGGSKSHPCTTGTGSWICKEMTPDSGGTMMLSNGLAPGAYTGGGNILSGSYSCIARCDNPPSGNYDSTGAIVVYAPPVYAYLPSVNFGSDFGRSVGSPAPYKNGCLTQGNCLGFPVSKSQPAPTPSPQRERSHSVVCRVLPSSVTYSRVALAETALATRSGPFLGPLLAVSSFKDGVMAEIVHDVCE